MTTRFALEGLQLRPGSRGAHVESYFFRATDEHGARAIWIKATVLRKPGGLAFAETWAVAFSRGEKPVGYRTRVPLAEAWFDTSDVGARIAGSSLSRTRAVGEVGAGDRAIRYDLTIESDAAPLRPLPEYVYGWPVASNKPTTPLPLARAFGTVVVHGETWKVADWKGSLGHNWGKAHTHAYAWAQACAWDDPDHDGIFFEAGFGKARVRGVPIPDACLINVVVRGVRYDLSDLGRIFRNRAESTYRRFRFEGENDLACVRGELWADTRDFAGLPYENPDGSILYCLNSKLASARIEVALRGRAPMILRTRRAALEIGTRDPSHGIEMTI